jgi:small GTP-binding protein
MIQKKICMLGSFAVGKTSLVAQFLTQGFSEKYHTTVGVKIDKKTVELAGDSVDLILWDIQGEDSSQQLYLSYLRGASGYLLVIDGTRRSTLTTAIAIQANVTTLLGLQVPFVVLVNKQDLEAEWQVQESDLQELAARSWHVAKTSAKTGTEVEQAFLRLATQILPRDVNATSASSS